MMQVHVIIDLIEYLQEILWRLQQSAGGCYSSSCCCKQRLEAEDGAPSIGIVGSMMSVLLTINVITFPTGDADSDSFSRE